MCLSWHIQIYVTICKLQLKYLNFRCYIRQGIMHVHMYSWVEIKEIFSNYRYYNEFWYERNWRFRTFDTYTLIHYKARKWMIPLFVLYVFRTNNFSWRQIGYKCILKYYRLFFLFNDTYHIVVHDNLMRKLYFKSINQIFKC